MFKLSILLILKFERNAKITNSYPLYHHLLPNHGHRHFTKLGASLVLWYFTCVKSPKKFEKMPVLVPVQKFQELRVYLGF